MLVLSRHAGDAIRISGNIWIGVLSIKNNQVKLGIVAPESVQILRDELAAGKPLHEIEDMMDSRENQTQGE